jgi:hypothetical protein
MTTIGLYGVISQLTDLFTLNAVWTANPTNSPVLTISKRLSNEHLGLYQFIKDLVSIYDQGSRKTRAEHINELRRKEYDAYKWLQAYNKRVLSDVKRRCTSPQGTSHFTMSQVKSYIPWGNIKLVMHYIAVHGGGNFWKIATIICLSTLNGLKRSI